MRYFRVYYEIAGGHVHTRWFAGANPNAEVTMGCCGDLTFTREEWDSLRALLRHGTVEFVDETTRRVRGQVRPARSGEPGFPPPPGPEAA